MAMASRSIGRVFRLDISHLKLVRDALKESHFIDANWFDLGVELSLPYSDLANIRAKWSSDPSQCLLECLSLWLTSANNRTWESLASALERMNQKPAATLIRNAYDDPASQIFQHYSNRILLVSLTDSCIQLLCTEGLITEDTQRKIERCGGSLSDTLRELMVAVTDDHNKLRSLGNILMELEETKPLAQDIIKDCDELFPEVDNIQINESLPNAPSVEEVFVSEVYNCRFDEVRVKFGDLRYSIIKLVVENVPSACNIKEYLSCCFPEVKKELSSVDTVKEVMNIVESRCNIINIVPIKAIVNKYHITGALKMITEFEEAVDDFCSKIKVKFMLNKKLSLAVSSLKAFEDLGKRIIVRSIHRGNSIIIVCYAPHHLLAALYLEAQENLTVLIKEFSLIRLTIGHYTVYDKRIRYKVMNNECLAKEITLANEEEQELETLLDYKERSIFEQDKQLNIIKKRKEYFERTLQTPESKPKVKLLTRGKLINKTFKSKKSDTQYFQTSLLMKAGREEALVEHKKVIELLQENISITSIQLMMSQKANIHKKDQCTQSPKSIYTARIDYHGIWRNVDLSFREGQQLEIFEKGSTFWWKGRSLLCGDEGDIPSSYVYSMLESLQLLEFILSIEEVSLPILQKIRNDSSSNDEKAFLFFEAINNDLVMISALRQDKEQHDKGVTGSVYWESDSVSLYSPSPAQCNEVISNTNNNHKKVELNYSSTHSTVSLLSSTELHTLHLRKLKIQYTPLTNDCIQYLCILLTNNKTIQELDINRHSISDRGVTNICQALEHNSTLTLLGLNNNPLITSTSGEALSHLLLNNSSLVELNVRWTSLSTESIVLFLQSLRYNKTIRRLMLDNRHQETCINTYPDYHLNTSYKTK
uniref:SH3 domain-containing protein n=1 Tax=Amphimedon queenslandica TaxID=400682 RepID=A0A1X7UC65_AMPQE